MMVNRLIFLVAFCVFVCHEISLVQTTYTCQTHADCKGSWLYKFCCGGESNSIDRTKRMCRYYKCLDKYCATQSDCGDPMLCCHSNICVDADRGCYGCTSNADCTYDHVCCKRSSPSNQAFCAKNCVGAPCNNNNDCAGEGECCRDGRCINTGGCFARCKSNLECDVGKYCSKKKSVWFWQDRCNETCVGEDCSTDDDCGPPNEYCIFGKCVKNRSPECSSDSDCTSGLHCCKKGYLNKNNECLAECMEKSCGTTADCGGSDEICNSNYICERRDTKPSSKKSFPSWLIPIIVTFVLLIVVGVFFVIVVPCYKRNRPSNIIQVNRESLLNTQSQGTTITNQFIGLNNPIQQEGTGVDLDLSTNHQEQNEYNPVIANPTPQDNDGYVNPLHSPTDQTCENTDFGLNLQQRARDGLQSYSQAS